MTSDPRALSHEGPDGNVRPSPLSPHNLLEASEWDRDLTERSRDLFCTHDLQGRLLSVTPSAARVLGYSVEELLRIPMRELIPSGFGPQFDEYLQTILRDGEARGLLGVVTRSGERRLWEYHNSLRSKGVAEPVVCGMAHDVTEQKRVERELRKSEERYRSLVAALTEGVVLQGADGTILASNESAAWILGQASEELRGQTSLDWEPYCIHEDGSPFPGQTHPSMVTLRTGKPQTNVCMGVRRPNGEARWISINSQPLFQGEQIPYAVVTSFADITDRRLREERVREYERVLESLDEMITVVNRDYRYVLANRAFLRYRGMAKDQLIGHRVTDVIREDVYQTTIKPRLDECFRGRVVNYAMKYSYPAMGERDLAITYLPVEGPTGIDRVACILKDVTERKQTEKLLQRSEESLNEAQRIAHIGSWDWNIGEGTLSWSDETFRQYDLVPNEITPCYKEWTKFVHPDDLEFADRAVNSAIEEDKPYSIDIRMVSKKGREFVIHTEGKVYRDETGKAIRFIGTQQDITDRKRIERELQQAKERLTEQKLYLEQEIDTELGFEDIIGQSKALKAVMENATKVASSDATVLLLGETGTGKELIARAIHRLSRRAKNSFIKMNCAAIPSGLLESELFGNERGAFTGAVSKKIGRLELADNGTIFLDEIGEISLALQPKLLRVLQDQEFERLGGTETLKVNFRLIAATNRDLAENVRKNEFRSDLYYRLNVFPIRVPPLRERRDDIPLLVEHFVQKCSRRMNKSITSVPKKTMEALVAWNWPGNVRELENFIERSVILTTGSVLAAPLNELNPIAAPRGEDETLKGKEREHILRALQQSHGQIGGPRGAATRLGLKRTTLQSKLKNLGINPRIPPPV